MTHPLLVINVVGLTRSLVGTHTPHLSALLKEGSSAPIEAMVPAVTCSVQTTYVTGETPSTHGIVANGWFFHDQNEVRFWHQSNQLVKGKKIWEIMKERDPASTCANLFWWYNMYCTADYALTVRPMYPADGRKIPDIYTYPLDWRDELNQSLGQFPLFNFWGPKSNIVSSRWIVDATLKTLEEKNPTLALVYLPHLDYCLQKLGPGHPDINKELALIDAQCGRLIAAAKAQGREIVVLSEYGIEAVRQPIHLNRILRQHDWIAVREELGRELLDAGASKAFAVADHQIAHVYIKDKQNIAKVKAILENVDGIEQVLDEAGKASQGLDHERSGELVVIAKPGAWFTYYYWDDETKAPDFAHTVDIHRKPGYDPVELFIDPKIRFPLIAVGWRLIKKVLGFRMLMDVIPTDASLVKGSHGRPPSHPDEGAFYISSRKAMSQPLKATQVRDFLLSHMFN